MQVSLGPGHIVLNGDPTSPPPLFLAHICCGQMVRWIKMPLGKEVGLGPTNIVLDGDPAPLPKAGTAQFLAHVYCGQTAGWIKVALGMKVGLSSGHIVLDGDPALLLTKGHSPPNFRSIAVVAKRSHISTSPKWTILCRVGHKTLSQSISLAEYVIVVREDHHILGGGTKSRLLLSGVFSLDPTDRLSSPSPCDEPPFPNPGSAPNF